ncbi:8939_t:CDS:2 [Paraglomus occultum]|uniref:8939_t:CDS:1 n=1 Tax=Paraglomus occultum TaxID=144539 RepID=A0A9N8VI81_9GLOM|nr:8939_t:CDS:2 [Paraglomus occultum]
MSLPLRHHLDGENPSISASPLLSKGCSIKASILSRLEAFGVVLANESISELDTKISVAEIAVFLGASDFLKEKLLFLLRQGTPPWPSLSVE